jgi:hypothetical protein
MELGNRYRAQKALTSLADKTSFDYLIREAKYKDHVEGGLDAAITLLEKAFDKIKDNPTPALYCWTKTNLGDLYGHANRYRESYQCYLEVLSKDPHYYHALKGIAWLAFSHDNNVANARNIVAYLQQRHPIPDYELLFSQMAASQQDSITYKQHIDRFMTVTHNELYGGMYNKYLFALEADEVNNASHCLQIAQEEVAHRPTPEAFSWLAWAYCRNGDLKTAPDGLALDCFQQAAAVPAAPRVFGNPERADVEPAGVGVVPVHAADDCAPLVLQKKGQRHVGARPYFRTRELVDAVTQDLNLFGRGSLREGDFVAHGVRASVEQECEGDRKRGPQYITPVGGDGRRPAVC